MLSAAKYSYTSPSGRLKITYWGIPLPALISDGTGNSPWYGFIVNPIYFMLVINALYVHLIQVMLITV